MLGDGFGNWVSTGFRDVIYQRSSVVGEGVEFDNREVSFCERASLVEEDGRCVFGVLDGLDGLVPTKYEIEVNRIRGIQRLNATHLK